MQYKKKIMFNEEPILCALIIFLGASALVVLGFGGYQTFLSGVDGMTSKYYTITKK